MRLHPDFAYNLSCISDAGYGVIL